MNIQTRVRKLLVEWQETLGLQDWVVHLRLYQRLSLDDQYCNWRFSEKVARIGLNVNARLMEEIEHDLVHELCHLILAPSNRVFDNLNENKVSKKERVTFGSEFNLAQNVAIENIVRVVYKLKDKEYPPHKE